MTESRDWISSLETFETTNCSALDSKLREAGATSALMIAHSKLLRPRSKARQRRGTGGT